PRRGARPPPRARARGARPPARHVADPLAQLGFRAADRARDVVRQLGRGADRHRAHLRRGYAFFSRTWRRRFATTSASPGRIIQTPTTSESASERMAIEGSPSRRAWTTPLAAASLPPSHLTRTSGP